MKRSFETSDRLLDAAERLFAERGIEATSLRAITSAAKANLAAVNYHFASKQALVEAVLRRRFVPLNEERLRLLDAAEKRRPLRLEGILHAFLAPTAVFAERHPHFLRFAGRVHIEPRADLHSFFMGLFGEIVRRFGAAFTRVLPRVPVPDLFWRMHFVVGAMIHSWLCSEDVPRLSGGMCPPLRSDDLVKRLIEFGAAGLRAGRSR